jgi:ATP-binding cassette subfamily B protein
MENEQMVMESIEALAESRTVLLLTHRLRSIREADRIVVLHEGRLVQQGGYEALISQPGVFREMVDPTVT